MGQGRLLCVIKAQGHVRQACWAGHATKAQGQAGRQGGCAWARGKGAGKPGCRHVGRKMFLFKNRGQWVRFFSMKPVNIGNGHTLPVLPLTLVRSVNSEPDHTWQQEERGKAIGGGIERFTATSTNGQLPACHGGRKRCREACCTVVMFTGSYTMLCGMCTACVACLSEDGGREREDQRSVPPGHAPAPPPPPPLPRPPSPAALA